MNCPSRRLPYPIYRGATVREHSGSPEIIRCLKRALAREVFTLLTTRVEVPVIDDLRPLRQARKLSLTTVAEHFNVWPATISKLERGTHRDDDLANSYREWLTAA